MTSATSSSLRLDPPTFTVDSEDDHLELWSFRLPVAFPLNALKGLEMSPTGVTKITANGQDYRLEVGDMEDTESFRVLVPKRHKNGRNQEPSDSDSSSSSSAEDDDDDDDDDDEKKDSGKIKMLVPLKKSFAKHFTVLADVPHMTESQLAPREGPPPQDKVRHAYSHVPQRNGLKRRWMPLGVSISMEDEQTSLMSPTTAAQKGRSNSVASTATKQETTTTTSVGEDTGPSAKKRKKLEEVLPSPDSDDSSEADEKLSKSERKAKKAEKKAAKKAKKEAKKAKKASKKVKKES